MTNYHINPKNLKPGRCFAKSPETCKFKNDEGFEKHYDTKEEASKAAETIGEKAYAAAALKKKKSKETLNDEQLDKVKETMSKLGYYDDNFEYVINNPSNFGMGNSVSNS